MSTSPSALRLERSGRVRSAAAATFAGTATAPLLGRTYTEVLRALIAQHGDLVLLADHQLDPSRCERHLLFQRADAQCRVVTMTTATTTAAGEPVLDLVGAVVAEFPDRSGA